MVYGNFDPCVAANNIFCEFTFLRQLANEFRKRKRQLENLKTRTICKLTQSLSIFMPIGEFCSNNSEIMQTFSCKEEAEILSDEFVTENFDLKIKI
jgi:hypothetical protein